MAFNHDDHSMPLKWMPAKLPETWVQNCESFLNRISPSQRAAVERILSGGPHEAGRGIRFWLEAIAYRNSPLPAHIPSRLIDTYLSDPEAEPLHQCEACGVAIPVRPNRLEDAEADPELIYFDACPVCQSHTGPYFYYASGKA